MSSELIWKRHLLDKLANFLHVAISFADLVYHLIDILTSKLGHCIQKDALSSFIQISVLTSLHAFPLLEGRNNA